jgi:uncharacterized integral membrane protein
MADRDDIKGAGERAVSPGFIVGVILLLAVLDFIVQNNDKITLHFLFFEGEARVWTLVVITSVLAVVATELLSRVIRRSRRRD